MLKHRKNSPKVSICRCTSSYCNSNRQSKHKGRAVKVLNPRFTLNKNARQNGALREKEKSTRADLAAARISQGNGGGRARLTWAGAPYDSGSQTPPRFSLLPVHMRSRTSAGGQLRRRNRPFLSRNWRKETVICSQFIPCDLESFLPPRTGVVHSFALCYS